MAERVVLTTIAKSPESSEQVLTRWAKWQLNRPVFLESLENKAGTLAPLSGAGSKLNLEVLEGPTAKWSGRLEELEGVKLILRTDTPPSGGQQTT